MTDEQPNDADGDGSPKPKPGESARPESPGPQKVSRGATGTAIIALLLALIALGASGYIWYHVQFTQQKNTSDVALGRSEIDGKLDQLTSELDRLSAAQQGLISRDSVELSIDRNLDEVREHHEELEAAVNRINSSFDRGIDAWLLEEVEQMLRVANQGMALTGNTEAAIRALQLADDSLQSLADPRYASVRRAIARDISELERLDLPDITGLASELIALASAVPGLPLANEPDGVPLDTSLSDPADGDQAPWRTELRSLLSDLIGLVSIQKVSESPTPLLAPVQRYFLEQNLQVILHGSQLALLKGEYELFRRHLEQAVDWTMAYFDTGQPVTKTFLADLNRIRRTTLEVTTPDISGSMTAFRRVDTQGVLE